jgi:hypothetical protein
MLESPSSGAMAFDAPLALAAATGAGAAASPIWEEPAEAPAPSELPAGVLLWPAVLNELPAGYGGWHADAGVPVEGGTHGSVLGDPSMSCAGSAQAIPIDTCADTHVHVAGQSASTRHAIAST